MTASDDLMRIALGCDRLGSVNGLRGAAAERLVEGALALGIRTFDTAPIYGQGDSERIIGRCGGDRSDVTVITKVGQYFPLRARLLMPAKAVVARAAGRSPRLKRIIASRRAGLLPQDFSASFIEREARASLRRLRRKRLDILLLHSPPAEVLAAGEALAALQALRRAGLVERVGVAAEDVDGAAAAVDRPGVDVLQLPFDGSDACLDVLARATARGITTVVRGIMRAGAGRVAMEASPAERAAAMIETFRSVLARPDVGMVLVGTVQLHHLAELVDDIATDRPSVAIR